MTENEAQVWCNLMREDAEIGKSVQLIQSLDQISLRKVVARASNERAKGCLSDMQQVIRNAITDSDSEDAKLHLRVLGESITDTGAETFGDDDKLKQHAQHPNER